MTTDRRSPSAGLSLTLLTLACMGFGGCLGHTKDPRARIRGPIPTRILQPAGLIFPAPIPRTAHVLGAGRSRATVDIAYSSIFERQVRSGFQANFDGEIGRTSLRFAHGIGSGAEIVVAPVVLFATSGFLDRIVDEFHSATGFEGGGRDSFPRDLYSMRLVNNGVVAYELEEDQLRFADLPISWVQSLRAEDAHGPAVATRVTVELPTGSSDRGTGSDGIDWNVGVLLERSLGRWTITGGVDGMVADRPRAFQEAGIDVRKLLYASGGVEYRWNDRTSLLFQAVFQSPLTRSLTFEEIDREIIDLGFGLARDLGEATTLLLSFHEDAVAASGPDLTVYVGLTTRF